MITYHRPLVQILASTVNARLVALFLASNAAKKGGGK